MIPVFKIKLSAFFFIAILFSACTSTDQRPVFSHQGGRTYIQLYPDPGSVYYYKITADTAIPDTIKFLLHFDHTFSDFMEYEFRQDDQAPVAATHGEFTVKFYKFAEEDIYSNLNIKVFSGKNVTKTFTMKLSFDPAIKQEKSGRPGAKDALFIRETDVGYRPIPFPDFIPLAPPEKEIKFLREEFGKTISGAGSSSEKITRLAKAVLDLLEPYRGIPGYTMDTLSAVEQLMMLKENKERVYCGNISEIFLSACLAFDIPGRKIGMGCAYDESSNPAIYHSDYHTVVEVYNASEMQWQLIDLSLYLVQAKYENGRLLNCLDFYHLLNTPDALKKILVAEYDPVQKEINTPAIEKAKNFSKWRDYYKQNQRLWFIHRNGSLVVN